MNKKYILIPQFCPTCQQKLTINVSEEGIKTLLCTNDFCNSKIANSIVHYCSKNGVDIKGLGKETISKLIEYNWIDSISDIYKLNVHRNEWIKQPGFGIASVDNILNAIETSRKVNLDKFIAALGIPLIGSKASKDLADRFCTWTNFINAIETKFKFYELPNFGTEMHLALINFDYTEANNLTTKYLEITTVEPKTADNSSSISGKTFVITGKLALGSRDKVKQMIEEAGGKVVGSVSSKTNYLINNDLTSTSGKNKTAKELNIPVINENEFLKLLEGDI